MISQTNGSSNQTCFLGNALDSTQVLTDGSGTVTGTKTYEAFGAVRATTGSALGATKPGEPPREPT